MLGAAVVGLDTLAVPAAWDGMVGAVRDVGRAGIAAAAIAAVDAALWDLKARLLGVARCDLFGTVRDGIDVYGSGGFTSRPDELAEQLAGWVDQGIAKVKMKAGRDPVPMPSGGRGPQLRGAESKAAASRCSSHEVHE